MTNIYILLIIELVLLSVAWLITNGDLASPSVTVLLVMIVSTFLNIYAIDLWDDSTFYIDTVIAVGLGLAAVVMADALMIAFVKRKRLPIQNNTNTLTEINIDKGKLLFVTLLCIIFSVLYYLNIRSIGLSVGLNVTSAISQIKVNYKDPTMQLNVFVRQGYKFITVFA